MEIGEIVYTVDERQLRKLWTVLSCLAHVREIIDPLARSEILIRAQIHLTAFTLDLQPVPRDVAGSRLARRGHLTLKEGGSGDE